MFEVKTFQNGMEQGIIDLILPIQNLEFNINITIEQQPDLMKIDQFYQVNNGNFWCALVENRVVGTIAFIDMVIDNLH